jgi:3-deoxy-manno-octulosonate cytidylyltransferase (CMP-KDO synthetase)
MKTLCVIPARFASSRLPRKMLVDIQGKPMVVRTFEGAQACVDIDQIIIATDSTEIAHVVKQAGAEVMMTPEDLPTGSDRVAYVAERLPQYDVVINLQGDEPFIKATMLSALIAPFAERNAPVMSTVAFPILTQEEYDNPNFVKVITDFNGNALFFSRAPIPYLRIDTPVKQIPALHHMGLYAYQRDFLLKYTKLAQTPLEHIELLEQLRALEHGYDIRVVKTHERTLEVNTPQELTMAQEYPLD